MTDVDYSHVIRIVTQAASDLFEDSEKHGGLYRNKWVTVSRYLNVYIRIGRVAHEHVLWRCLDVVRVEIEAKRQKTGMFTGLIAELEAFCVKKGLVLRVESIFNRHLEAWLLRRDGWEILKDEAFQYRLDSSDTNAPVSVIHVPTTALPLMIDKDDTYAV